MKLKNLGNCSVGFYEIWNQLVHNFRGFTNCGTTIHISFHEARVFGINCCTILRSFTGTISEHSVNSVFITQALHEICDTSVVFLWCVVHVCIYRLQVSGGVDPKGDYVQPGTCNLFGVFNLTPLTLHLVWTSPTIYVHVVAVTQVLPGNKPRKDIVCVQVTVFVW